ncbi:hypothetical protein R1sor_015587 [Riccia sorocarpa]|uniref:Uncharacterized protein n=1 Tax=Riccia sorocarpa TaxID=122646 RepID=A0ABD3HD08_9MARC
MEFISIARKLFRLASLSENNFEKLSSLIEGLWEDMRRENKFQEDLAVVLRARSCCEGFILDEVILRICYFWAIHPAVGQFVCLDGFENAALQEGRKEMLSASLKWLNDESERCMDYILADKTRFVAYVFTSAIFDEE